MNRAAPPKKERGLRTALKTAELKAAYCVLSFLQAPFSLAFWRIEQRKARLQDRIDNEGSD
jgi:hypothetical protein